MLILRKRAFARAGLIGNPSDGYHGKTLSISLRNFWADVVLYEWDQIELVLSQEDRSRFGTVEEVAALCVYLASPESGYMTGSELTLDGGLLAGSAASPGD